MLPIDGLIVVTTCRPIKRGEQVCISYHGTKFQSPFIERQQIIEQEFYFKCKCERCALEVTDSLKPAAFLDEQTRKLLKNSAETLLYTMEKRKSVTELCVKLLNENGRISWCEDLGMVLSNFFVLLHTKFLLKSHYWTQKREYFGSELAIVWNQTCNILFIFDKFWNKSAKNYSNLIGFNLSMEFFRRLDYFWCVKVRIIPASWIYGFLHIPKLIIMLQNSQMTQRRLFVRIFQSILEWIRKFCK